MSDVVLRTRGLTKRYGDRAAVEDLSVTLERGRVYGLIGRNGAGKTTLMRMVCGLVTPTQGSIELLGDESSAMRQADLRRLGCLIEGPGLNPRMTARQNMHLHRILRGIPSESVESELLRLVGLDDTGRKRAGDFSLGMRQRLGIAVALIANPELLVLDEPINGLDPVGVVEVRDLIRRLSHERGTTVLVSSHNLPELYQTATDYLIVDRGRLCESLSLEELDVRCQQYLLVEAAEPARLVAALEAMGTTGMRVMPDGSVRIARATQGDDREALVRGLVARDVVPTTLAPHTETLESYFLSVIGGPR
ncbi:ABC transporter ATP-binding protein [Brooklawnia cerclae]|uniref:ABC-2 type transport system ATP-binding protein n=1 Tax=Brooklawnia cerclae TaxID=349934 RepID=A0ABX0SII9_9ACTN|nr:ATP-binding cassette domain-containing protein [Brooklawnia cerclae]NIH56557.1 ABC-2 type transport system ATP-binding protein [Brooklawnia cerclae]